MCRGKFSYMHVCLCGGMCMHECMHACVCVHACIGTRVYGGWRRTLAVVSLYMLPTLDYLGSGPSPGAHQLIRLDQLAKKPQGSGLHLHSAGIADLCVHCHA